MAHGGFEIRSIEKGQLFILGDDKDTVIRCVCIVGDEIMDAWKASCDKKEESNDST